MVRPRDGDGIKRTIVKRGDRFYAYEITSVMENGKKRTTCSALRLLQEVFLKKTGRARGEKTKNSTEAGPVRLFWIRQKYFFLFLFSESGVDFFGNRCYNSCK